jgi:membrane protein YdbS with pleckstrin-like domain
VSEHSRRAGATDELRHLLREDEELLWRGTPNRRRLVVDAVKAMIPVFVALGMIGVFVLFVAGLAVEASGGDPLSILPVFGGAAVVVAVLVVAVGLWYANRRHEYAEYAATDRRLISFGGGFGRDSSSVDWESVRDLEATVGGVDRAFGTGAIHVASKGRGDITFRYVERPHELAAALDRIRTGESQELEFGDQPGAPPNRRSRRRPRRGPPVGRGMAGRARPMTRRPMPEPASSSARVGRARTRDRRNASRDRAPRTSPRRSRDYSAAGRNSSGTTGRRSGPT